MPRTARIAPGGMVFHVLNRGVGRMNLFAKEGDYDAFERSIEKTLESRPMRICAYCLMPDHWHFVVWPERDGDLGAFMQKLTVTHVRNWQEHRRRVGYGHVYQSRYMSFPVETDEYFYQVTRYVERNALWANLVDRAETWRWSSLWRRACGKAAGTASGSVHGPCRSRAGGQSWSISRNRKRNWRRSVEAWQGDNPTEATLGRNKLRRNWTWNQPSAPVDAQSPQKIRPVPFFAWFFACLRVRSVFRSFGRSLAA